MTTDANLQIRNYFDGLYRSAKRLAKCQAALCIEILDLSELTTDQQLKKLWQELARVKEAKAGFQRKEYLLYADEQHALCNVFSAQLLFYNQYNKKEEEEKLFEAIILMERKKKLTQVLEQTMTQLPPFTNPDFEANVLNFAFYELNRQPFGTSDKEYAAMRNWQTQMKDDCVDQESRNFIGRFIEQVGHIPGNRDLIQGEKDQLDFILGNAHQLSPSQLIKKTLKLKALTADSMPENTALWYESFCQFLNKSIDPYALSPKSLQLAFSNIQRGKVSLAPVCCWSLARYGKWLDDVLEGKVDFKQLPNLSYEKLFEQTLDKGLANGKKIISEFCGKYPSGEMTEDEYQLVIFNKLNRLRFKFNGLPFPDYYRLLPQRESLKSCFINHCSLSTDIELHCNELTKTIELDQMIGFLQAELQQIDPGLIRTCFDLQLLNHHINEIISIMIPDNDLMSQLKQASTQASLWVEGRKPILFIELDLTDSFSAIFRQAAHHLQQIFDYQPAELKAIYAVCQIRDLDYLEITSKRDGQGLRQCIAELKRIFQIELQYKEYQHRCDSIDFLLKETERQEIKPENTTVTTTTTKILAFNYNNIRDDKLYLVLNALLKLKAIPPDISLTQFRALFNGKEVSDPLEWWADQGDLMTFIKETVRINNQNFTSYNQHWNIAVKCFVKKGGQGLFDPNKLKFSKPTSLEQKFIAAARKFK